MNHEIPNFLIRDTIIRNLDSSFDVARTALLTWASEPSLENIKLSLMASEVTVKSGGVSSIQVKQEEGESAFAAHSARNQASGGNAHGVRFQGSMAHLIGLVVHPNHPLPMACLAQLTVMVIAGVTPHMTTIAIAVVELVTLLPCALQTCLRRSRIGFWTILGRSVWSTPIMPMIVHHTSIPIITALTHIPIPNLAHRHLQCAPSTFDPFSSLDHKDKVSH